MLEFGIKLINYTKTELNGHGYKIEKVEKSAFEIPK